MEKKFVVDLRKDQQSCAALEVGIATIKGVRQIKS
ncbi:MAG: hypothetical protein H6Q37_1691 [Chloroflexi bacterium]|jgi:hypothetical protein|nr:hypothetical protein [Chloroflexota bacterium]